MSAATTTEARLQHRRRALAAALVVAGATTLATGLAHALGGGAAPDALLLAAGLVVTLLVLAPVLGSRRSLARQGVAVAIAQVVQHGLYSLPGAAHPTAAADHAHHADAALPGAAEVLHAHTSMPLAHLVAGALTLALLRLVPRALAAMLEAMSLRRAVAVLRWAGMPARRRGSVTASSPARRRTLDVLHAALVPRGPPLALV
ncbi:hypothetical protein [Agrococcus sp. Marseille-P2731]|uniref:hypothetical protein n=1 Tax=Agrococcus sp. Marseille-P2731 TaxID=1841862 RepID=UPI00093174AA|nr:hypothetical protein [Agrococcus sp. Marseille-P2731]